MDRQVGRVGPARREGLALLAFGPSRLSRSSLVSVSVVWRAIAAHSITPHVKHVTPHTSHTYYATTMLRHRDIHSDDTLPRDMAMAHNGA